jgi:hypothetical protein
VGLRLETAAVSRLTISSQRTCALRSASIVGTVLLGARRSAWLALVKAKPARRSTRVIIGGAACRGRYGPGWQSPASPYKLGNRLRLATFPPVRNVSPFCVYQCCPHLFGRHAAANPPDRHQPTGGPSSVSSWQDIRHVPTRSLIVQEHVAGRKCGWQRKGAFFCRSDDMREWRPVSHSGSMLRRQEKHA